MARDLVFVSTFKNNRIIILDCLGEQDQNNGRVLEEDVNDVSSALGSPGYCVRKRIANRWQLVAELKLVEQSCSAGILKPVLHFEAHGHTRKGLLLSQSSEYISWQDLSDMIAVINSASGNNTGLVLASCNGFAISDQVQMELPCPFHFMLAPDEVVIAGYLRADLTRFCQTIIRTSDLNVALAGLPPSYKRFLCTEWFHLHFARYVKGNFAGKAKRKFTNSLLDAIVRKHGAENITAWRTMIKTVMETPQFAFMVTADMFLHGRNPVSYGEFEAFITQKGTQPQA